MAMNIEFTYRVYEIGVWNLIVSNGSISCWMHQILFTFLNNIRLVWHAMQNMSFGFANSFAHLLDSIKQHVGCEQLG